MAALLAIVLVVVGLALVLGALGAVVAYFAGWWKP